MLFANLFLIKMPPEVGRGRRYLKNLSRVERKKQKILGKQKCYFPKRAGIINSADNRDSPRHELNPTALALFEYTGVMDHSDFAAVSAQIQSQALISNNGVDSEREEPHSLMEQISQISYDGIRARARMIGTRELTEYSRNLGDIFSAASYTAAYYHPLSYEINGVQSAYNAQLTEEQINEYTETFEYKEAIYPEMFCSISQEKICAGDLCRRLQVKIALFLTRGPFADLMLLVSPSAGTPFLRRPF